MTTLQSLSQKMDRLRLIIPFPDPFIPPFIPPLSVPQGEEAIVQMTLSRIPFLEPILVEEVQSLLKKRSHFRGPSAPQNGVTPQLGEKMGGYWPIPNLMSPNQYLKVLFKMIRQEYCSNGLRPSPPSVTKVMIVLVLHSFYFNIVVKFALKFSLVCIIFINILVSFSLVFI